MYDRGAYQSGVPVTPVGMADFECARVLVWREGFGWVERDPDAVAECERVVDPEQEAMVRAWLRWPA